MLITFESLEEVGEQVFVATRHVASVKREVQDG